MRAAGVPRARAYPAVDVSSSAQAKEIRDSLTARITAGVIPSSVLTLEALKEIGVTEARAMLRASRKERRRATLRGKIVPRLVDMLREGESTPPSRRDHTRPLCPQGHRCRCREATTASQVTAIARSHAEAEARQPTDNIDAVG